MLPPLHHSHTIHQQTIYWNDSRRELCVGEAIVKRYREPAPNQEAILRAFEEEGWPPRIDDPLPPVNGIDPKRRLKATIHDLNRNQRIPLVHFHGDGTGTGILWDFVNAAQC
jgi:hypothetical protein